MTRTIQSPSVGQAVMQLDMEDRPFPIFRSHAGGPRAPEFRRGGDHAGRADPAGHPAR